MVIAGPDRLTAITVQRPARWASSSGKRRKHVELAPLRLHDALSCVEGNTCSLAPYQVWMLTATAAAAGAVTRTFHAFLGGGGATIVNSVARAPCRETQDCGLWPADEGSRFACAAGVAPAADHSDDESCSQNRCEHPVHCAHRVFARRIASSIATSASSSLWPWIDTKYEIPASVANAASWPPS